MLFYWNTSILTRLALCTTILIFFDFTYLIKKKSSGIKYDFFADFDLTLKLYALEYCSLLKTSTQMSPDFLICYITFATTLLNILCSSHTIRPHFLAFCAYFLLFSNYQLNCWSSSSSFHRNCQSPVCPNNRKYSHNEASDGNFTNINDLWQDLPVVENPEGSSSVAGIVTQQLLPNVINNLLYTEIRTSEMTNLGNILMGYLDDEDSTQDDSKIGRLSLAHEKLTFMPKLVCDSVGPLIKILDISDNSIENLEFLDYFTELTSLIADKNPISSTDTNMPCLPKLELLYLNKCKISNLYWVETLQYNCPKLKYLSLMGNPVVPAFMTTGNVYQYLQYRLYVISVIPSLIHLDDKKITDDERVQAKKMFPRPFVQNLFKSTQVRVPHYLRKLTGRTNNYFPKPAGRNRSSKPIENNYVV